MKTKPKKTTNSKIDNDDITSKIDKELNDLISKNESINKGISKILQIDKEESSTNLNKKQ